ncbi:uncharacterized protein BT62DRAFT_938840, partial [Guyanagaster necrorhizus]
MLLKPIFDVESRQPSETVIIAHVSPHSWAIIRSTNTLSYATPFRTVPVKLRGLLAYDFEDYVGPGADTCMANQRVCEAH